MNGAVFAFVTFIVFSLVLLAQQGPGQSYSPFDFLEANRKLTALNSKKYLSEFSNNCYGVTSENSESVLSCAIKDDDYRTPIVKVDYDIGQVPPIIKAALPEKFIEDTRSKKVSCLYRFKLLNDNLSVKDKRVGDDFGRTHSMDVGVSCASEDGVSTAFTYSTELYLTPELDSDQERNLWADQIKTKFNSENIFQLLQDNIDQGKVTYWKRGVGFINITDQKKWGLLQSTGQQEWFHSMVRKISGENAADYQYQNGSRDQWAAFVILAIGLQENRRLGTSCSLHFSADVGTRVSALREANAMNLNLQTQFSYHVSRDSSVYLRAQSEAIRRPTSTVVESTLATGFQSKKRGFVEVGMTQQNGNRADVYDKPNYLTGTNDKLIFLRVGKRF